MIRVFYATESVSAVSAICFFPNHQDYRRAFFGGPAPIIPDVALHKIPHRDSCRILPAVVFPFARKLANGSPCVT